MKILYIGGGFVGACSAAVSADSGHEVLVYDINSSRVEMLGSLNREKIESCLFESGLAEMIIHNSERIKFTSDYGRLNDFIDTVDAIFMCLPTPEKVEGSGESDLAFYNDAAIKLAKQLAERNHGAQEKYIIIVNKSTVPVAMANRTKEIFEEYKVKNFGIVSNPEFLVEGQAIRGSVNPQRIVIGAWKERDFQIMRDLYKRFLNIPSISYIEVNPFEAAAGKLLANFMLFHRLSATFDVVGRICEHIPNISFENIRGILISDERIGKWGFYDSVYAGGSCLIKDSLSLAHQLEEAGANANLIREALSANFFQRDNFFSRMEQEAKFKVKDSKIAILGVAFKKETNDIRHSPAIDIVKHILDGGAKEVRIYDPVAMENFQSLFSVEKNRINEKISYCSSEKDAILGTEVCFILTDWPQFKSLSDILLENCKKPYLIMDGRRMIYLDYAKLSDHGFDIIPVGGGFIKGSK
jgi:UDPglucose 6-dehydrogenase